MEEIYHASLSSKNFNSVKVDSSWNFADYDEDEIHRIHAYPAKFPSFIARRAIEDMEKERKIQTVGDVFCGCGTTSYEAMLKQKDFWGCDINPVAVLIAKAKSNVYTNTDVLRYFRKIAQSYPSERKKITDKTIDSVNSRIHYWFNREQIKDLLALRRALDANIPNKSKYKLFYQVAFSNILKSTSKWLQKSIKPTIDGNKPIKNVWEAFDKQVLMMKKANGENIGKVKKTNKIEIKQGSILTIHSKSKIDLLVTSPPYVTSYEYADLHQMSALWLGFTEDYKDLRKGTIGSIFHDTNFQKNKNQLIPSGKLIVEKLFKVDKRRAKSTAKYFVDMQKSIKKCHSLLKKEGQSVFVIGNTEYRGIRINNAKHLVESMFESGFKRVFITKRKISNKLLTPYRTRTGQFSTATKASRKIYAEEFIVKGIK